MEIKAALWDDEVFVGPPLKPLEPSALRPKPIKSILKVKTAAAEQLRLRAFEQARLELAKLRLQYDQGNQLTASEACNVDADVHNLERPDAPPPCPLYQLADTFTTHNDVESSVFRDFWHHLNDSGSCLMHNSKPIRFYSDEMSQQNSAFSFNAQDSAGAGVNASGLSRDEAKQLYERTQKRWSQTHDQLANIIKERKASPLGPVDMRQKDAEIAHLRMELAKMQAEMEEFKKELQSAGATILQQQATIRNQSKAIENPRPGQEFSGTPRHQSNNFDVFGTSRSQQAPPPGLGFHGHSAQSGQMQQPLRSIYGPVPPMNTNAAFSAHSSNNSVGLGGSSTIGTPQLYAAPGIPSANQYGSSEVGRPQTMDPFASTQIDQAPFSPVFSNPHLQDLQPYASPVSIITNPRPETSVPQTVIALDATTISGDDEKVIQAFQRIFDMAHEYAKCHANFPSTNRDSFMPAEVKNRLLMNATPTTAFGIMNDANTRYLLVGKIMITWIIKHVFKQSAFNNLDSGIDNIIQASRAALYQSTPPQVRYLMLKNISNEMAKLRGHPEFAAHVDFLCRDRASQLVKLVKPTMHHSTVGVWEDLLTFLREAYRITELVFNGTDEFSFDFPELGRPFNTDEMVNIDPHLGGYEEEQLNKMRVTVRLGCTPVVRVRKNVVVGEPRTEVLVKAKVLLRK